MKTKVTLSMDKDFVERAKRFAASKNRSLSSQVEESLSRDIENDESVGKKLAAIERLAGSVNFSPEDVQKSFKQLKYEAYKEKYDLP